MKFYEYDSKTFANYFNNLLFLLAKQREKNSKVKSLAKNYNSSVCICNNLGEKTARQMLVKLTSEKLDYFALRIEVFPLMTSRNFGSF